MPKQRYTIRQRLIKECEKGFFEAAKRYAEHQSTGPFGIHELEMYYNALQYLYQNRYLAPRSRLPFSTDLRDRVLEEYSAHHFKSIMHITPAQFASLVELISRSSQFRPKNDNFPQAPVEIQLKVALFRLGTKGTAVEKVAWVFGVS
ncbi:hypothetical protein BC939DRAFT_529412 [Gamsiella multidivaricata]|uniref:uncharacterized protein n=1 Tax=Gamsiella multidivaricata TaxID=101098 RepID=UPI0022200288|nr:uncharacterized protein BC939DRAFT_529412 [Gamsiella multidivaricata]KAG0354915.1 hypothetical protein BGZ54_001414 [Gamsiella multidivaricata]KAI7822704.1 hypothetical protein BC939DRAFT_529412 [Gamsiella multidivaricata]